VAFCGIFNKKIDFPKNVSIKAMPNYFWAYGKKLSGHLDRRFLEINLIHNATTCNKMD